MKIPYFPGCTLKTTAMNFELSAIGANFTFLFSLNSSVYEKLLCLLQSGTIY